MENSDRKLRLYLNKRNSMLITTIVLTRLIKGHFKGKHEDKFTDYLMFVMYYESNYQCNCKVFLNGNEKR